MTQDEIVFIVSAYLLGSIPFGYILYYLFNKKDIRRQGSGNIGAANVLRTQGKISGIVTLLLDILKGVIVMVYGFRHFHAPGIIILGGAAVLIGHMFPLYLKFKGGKGAATFAGILLILHFPSAMVAMAVLIITIAITRRVSAGSLAGAVTAFFMCTFTQVVEVSLVVLVMTILVILRHNENIKRLYNGTEHPFEWKKTNAEKQHG